MERFKRIMRRILFLPQGLAALIALPSFALVIYVLLKGERSTPMAYLSYFASAYALVLTAAHIPGVVRAFRTGFAAHPLLYRTIHSSLGERYRADMIYRAEISLYAGLGVNLLYVAVHAISGIAYRSEWFGVLAGYYLLLALLRFLLLQHVYRVGVGRQPATEWKRYRLCGVVLLGMNQALAMVVYLMVYKDNGFDYPGFLIYAMAAYAFYAVISAIVNMLKFKRQGSPVLSAAKAVSFVAALVSMLSLEAAMLAAFGSAEDASFRLLMISATGIAICAFVLVIAVYMIIRATREIRALNKREKRT